MALFGRAMMGRQGAALVSYTDNFNRADNNDITGGGSFPWTEWTTDGGLQIVSNTLRGPGSAAAARAGYNVSLTNDHYIQVTYVNASDQRMCIRMNTPGPGTAISFYDCGWTSASGGTWTTRKIVAATPSTIDTTTGISLSGNDVMRFQVIGTNIQIFRNGVSVVSFTDTAVPSGQYVGVRLDSSSRQFDDFECGTL